MSRNQSPVVPPTKHEIVQRTFLFVGGDGLIYRCATANPRRRRKVLLTHFTPLQLRFISVFVSQASSQCFVIGSCGHVTEQCPGRRGGIRMWSLPPSSLQSH